MPNFHAKPPSDHTRASNVFLLPFIAPNPRTLHSCPSSSSAYSISTAADRQKMSSFIDKAKNFAAEKVVDLPKPEASMSDVDIKDVNRDSVTYHAMIDVKNPYSHSIPICEINYSLKSDGQLILSGTMADPGSIAGDATTKFEVPLKVPHNVLVNLVKDVCRDWDIDYDLNVGLIVDIPIIGNFTIPLNSKGEVKLPTLKDFF